MVATLISTPYLGAWIDLSSRLRVATTICVAQATVVTVSFVLLALFLHFQDAIVAQQVHSAGFNALSKHYMFSELVGVTFLSCNYMLGSSFQYHQWGYHHCNPERLGSCFIWSRQGQISCSQLLDKSN